MWGQHRRKMGSGVCVLSRTQKELSAEFAGARGGALKLMGISRCSQEGQTRWGRGSKALQGLKEKNKAAFFSPSENRCLPASNLKPEEREFDVDSGASMHMISKKDLNSAEMDTLTKSCSPTIVITANGEVQTKKQRCMSKNWIYS